MLPPILNETGLTPFKFWHNSEMLDGVYFGGELFYRQRTLKMEQRAKLFHSACKIVSRDRVLITITEQTCSLWVCLRSPGAHALHLHLPSGLLGKPRNQPHS